MDILNFISWIRGRRQVTSVDPAKTLIPIGLKDGRRDDEYLAGAISVEDLATQIAPQPTYKVYTALLTQSGGDNGAELTSGILEIGVTYRIDSTGGSGWDFTNVGAPNNNPFTYFVATGTTPNSWQDGQLTYNTGAPVVTVLENTIGNVWFTYEGNGSYWITSNGLFTINKTWGISDSVFATATAIPEPVVIDVSGYLGSEPPNTIGIRLIGGDYNGDSLLNNTPIEIRVYN
jgi:hypothetical protein